jgi:hypothetical protein
VGQAEHARLAGGVVGAGHAAELGRHARDVDDPAPPPGPHPRQHRLRQQERRLQVDGDRLVEVPLGDLLRGQRPGDASVVDEDVHRPQARLDLRRQPRHLGGDGYVGHRDDAPPAEGGHLGGRFAGGLLAGAVVDGHVGPGPHQGDGDGTADAPAGPCHQRDLAGQIIHA